MGYPMGVELTDQQFVSLAIPTLPGGQLIKNGVVVTASQLVSNALETAGTKEGAIALIFRMLMSDDLLLSEKLDQYEYEKRTGKSFEDWAFYWEGLDRANLYTNTDIAPTVAPGGISGLPWWPLPPAVR